MGFLIAMWILPPSPPAKGDGGGGGEDGDGVEKIKEYVVIG